MSGALEIAAIGMQVQQRALETIASNISNVNTAAFKRADLRFAELVSTQPHSGSGIVGLDSLAGVKLLEQPLFDQNGKVESTGNSNDIAIEGTGFIELLGPQGRTLLWRGGTLRVLEDGTLATSGGIALKANIQVPEGSGELRIDRTGKIFATTSQSGVEVELGAITLVKVADPTAVQRVEGGIYALDDNSGVTEASPGDQGMGYVIQSALERSNVNLNSEMVALMISQRAYAASAQVVRAADEFLSTANSLRR